MKRTLLLWLWLAAPALAQETASAPRELSFPLDLAIVDPASPEKLPPYIVMFEDGADDKGKDVKGPLGRLEALRGASKMFPESNKDPGLPVVLRGLRFHRSLARAGEIAGYDLELQGEYNTVKVPLADEDMRKFLAGERVVLSLKGAANFGVYSYVSVIKLDVQFGGGQILIYAIDGDFSFREGFRTYTSKTKTLAPPPSRPYLYRGEQSGLPNLPQI